MVSECTLEVELVNFAKVLNVYCMRNRAAKHEAKILGKESMKMPCTKKENTTKGGEDNGSSAFGYVEFDVEIICQIVVMFRSHCTWVSFLLHVPFRNLG